MNTSKDRSKKIIAVLRLSILGFIVLGGSAFLYIKLGNQLFSKDSAQTFIDFLQANKNHSFTALVIAQAIQAIICIIPGQPIQIAASYLFGITGALLTSVSGIIIGSAISFYISRILGRGAIHDLFGKERINIYSEKLNSPRALKIIIIIYLIPGLPKDLVCYAAGISEIKFPPFIIVSTIARIPAMMGSILFGFFFEKGNYTAIIILCIISAIIAILCLIFRNRILALIDELAQKEITHT